MGDLHHDGAMADQLHAETGQKLFVMLLTADEEAQMKALAHDDATAAPAMNAIPHRQKYLPVFLLRNTICFLLQAAAYILLSTIYIIR